MIPQSALERAMRRAFLLREPCAIVAYPETPPRLLHVVSLHTWALQETAVLGAGGRLLATVHPDGSVEETEAGRAYPSPVGSPYATM